jgi:L-fucose isomerase-like protein
MNMTTITSPKPILGLCPIGKFVFSHTDAMRWKVELQAALRQWQIPFVDLDGVIEDGMIRNQAQVAAATAHFRKHEVTGLFMPHCNFGTEGAAGVIGRDVGVPLLLWGPRDEAPEPDGRRLRDSLCGMFATSKVLHKLGVPFSYIENCRIGEPQLERGVRNFLRTAHAAQALRRGMRIGHIGQRIDFFWTTIVNESELLERFRVEVLPIDMVLFIRDVRQRAAAGAKVYGDEVAGLRKTMEIEGLEDAQLMNILALRDQALHIAAEQGLDSIVIQDFNSLIEEFGAYCLLANSLISDRLPLSMESDIHGAVSTLLLSRATGGQPSFLADITVRHPTDDNGVLLWHCGAPHSMGKPGCTPQLGRHWILPSPVSGMTHFPLKDGPITITRFDGDRGEYKLAIGQGVSMEGPFTQNNYVWMKVDDWPRWERTLMQGPWIHHAAMGYDHCGGVLEEMCRFVPDLKAVRLDQEGEVSVSVNKSKKCQ